MADIDKEIQKSPAKNDIIKKQKTISSFFSPSSTAKRKSDLAMQITNQIENCTRPNPSEPSLKKLKESCNNLSLKENTLDENTTIDLVVDDLSFEQKENQESINLSTKTSNLKSMQKEKLIVSQESDLPLPRTSTRQKEKVRKLLPTKNPKKIIKINNNTKKEKVRVALIPVEKTIQNECPKLKIYLSKLKTLIESSDSYYGDLYADSKLMISSKTYLKHDQEDDSASIDPLVFPEVLNPSLIYLIQGRTIPMSVVVTEFLNLYPSKKIAAECVDIQIKKISERVCYGTKSKKANIYEDSDPRAMWCWEVSLVENYVSSTEEKIIKETRLKRRKHGKHVRALLRAIEMLEKKPVDQSKLSIEEARISKIERELEINKQRLLLLQKKEEERQQQKLEKDLRKAEKDEERERRLEDKKKGQQVIVEGKKTQSLLHYFKKNQEQVEQDIAPSAMELCEKRVKELDKKMKESMESYCQNQFVKSLPFQSLKKKHKFKKKRKALFQFHDNYRPAYYGVGSRLLQHEKKRGRKPFFKHPHLDYTIDSDEEWEEEEPGDTCSGSEDEGEAGESCDDELDYGDHFLAYEDEFDYVDDVRDEETKESESQQKKKEKLVISKEKKNNQPRHLHPIIIQRSFNSLDDIKDAQAKFACYRIEMLCERIDLSTIASPSTVQQPQKSPTSKKRLKLESIRSFLVKNTSVTQESML